MKLTLWYMIALLVGVFWLSSQVHGSGVCNCQCCIGDSTCKPQDAGSSHVSDCDDCTTDLCVKDHPERCKKPETGFHIVFGVCGMFLPELSNLIFIVLGQNINLKPCYGCFFRSHTVDSGSASSLSSWLSYCPSKADHLW